MIVCLVTDRQKRSPVDQAREAAAAGVDLIQIRERDLEARDLAELARAIVAVTRGSSTRVVVNDRVDVALTSGADGVHLRGDSIPLDRVRGLAPAGFLIGASVRSGADAVAAGAAADYLIAGTAFPTSSKRGMTTFLGVEGLAAVVKVTTLPVLAIGGVTVERATEVAGAGVRGVAAIGLFTDPDRPIKDVVRQLRERFKIGGEKKSWP